MKKKLKKIVDRIERKREQKKLHDSKGGAPRSAKVSQIEERVKETGPERKMRYTELYGSPALLSLSSSFGSFVYIFAFFDRLILRVL